MTETITLTKLERPNVLNLSPTTSISKDGVGTGPSASVHPATFTDEESPSVVHGRQDPYRLRDALKTDAELAELRNRRRTGKKIEQFHRGQNELIGQLLKPLEEHTSDAQDAEEGAKLPVKIAVYASFIANLILCGLQIYATATSGSLAILAAGIDSFFDIGANFILGWFHRKSTRLDSNKWPVGGSRLETIGNITYGSIMASVNLVVVVECIRNMISSHEGVDFKLVPLINVAAALAVKLGLFLYCFALRNASSQVRMLWEDHRNDLFVNGFAVLMYAGGAKVAWWLDPTGGLIIAVAIIGSWTRTLYGQFGYLAGRSAPHDFLQLVIYKVATFSEEIQQVDTVRAYHSGPNYFVEVDIVMPGDTPLWKAHDLSQAMQDKLETLPGVERAFVHVDHETTHRPEHRKGLVNAAPDYAAYFRCNKGNLLSRGRVQRRGPPLPGGQATLRFQLSFNHHPMTQPPPKPSSRSAGSHGTREDEKKQHSKPKDLSHVPCKFFKAGQCTAGAACPFSHASAEPGQPKQVCQWFLSGNCRFAHKCALAHIHPGEPMSMDRKNKKAAQQAMQQQQAQEGGTSSSTAGGSTANTAKERDRSQQQNRRDRDKDKDKERSVRRDRAPGGTSSGSRPPRDRASASEKRRDSTSTAQGDEPPTNGMTSSVATLRPPIRIGKGPSTSASVTAPPVLRDTSATATMAPPKTSNESEAPTGEKPSYASVTLEHLQAQSHSRQATITPASETLALSDYSKTPSAIVYDLPPSTTSLSSPKNELLDSPTSLVHPLSSRSNAREGATSRERMRNDSSTSPPLSKDDAPVGRYGPVGSPPRAGFANGSPADSTGTGRGALSSLFASLAMNPSPTSNQYTSPPHQHQAAAVTPQKDDLGPSSVTSQSSLHAHMNANVLGTSPFSMPGSRSLFMPLSSSQTSQSNIPAYLAGGQGPLKVGVPASFAGSRAVGWGIGGEARRPSLPGHNQRPSLGAASLRSGILDESAFEEETEDLEAEEFLPSSLSDLLTREERERRFSRGGAIRPTKESLLPTEGLNTPVEDDEVWERTVRQRPNAGDQLSPDNANAFSRSVPATNLIGQVRSLWDRDPTANSGLAATSSTGMARTNAPGGITQDMFGGVSGSYGPSPSMLSSSLMSNASNAFLQSSRLGAGDVHPSHKPLVNDLQVGSYNPSSMLYQKQQQMSHAAHQHHSSISGFPSSLSARNGTQGVTSQAAGSYSMYSGPADLGVENKSGIASMYGQRTTSQQVQQRPAMTTQNTSTHAHANDSLTGLRHEPGQSLPRGLGAGLSRLHFVPAGSLGSTVGSPPPGSGFGSTNPVASPPYGNFHVNMVGSGRGEPNDLAAEGKYPGGAQKSNYGSGLTARLMAAGVGSQSSSSQAPYQSDPTQGDGRTAAMSIHNVRNQHSTWGSGAVDDVDVDEGTLFNMD